MNLRGNIVVENPIPILTRTLGLTVVDVSTSLLKEPLQSVLLNECLGFNASLHLHSIGIDIKSVLRTWADTYLTVSEPSALWTGTIQVTCRKKTKLTTLVWNYSKDSNGLIVFGQDIPLAKLAMSSLKVKPEASFNTSLTIEQEAARQSVLLPHTQAQTWIDYIPDLNDDMDEEDPDDDLVF